MVSVRQATPDDIDAICVVHRSSIRELCSNHYTPDQVQEWTAALEPHGYTELLSSKQCLVAEEGGTLVGFGILDLENGLVNATYVSPRAVGKGVGRRLMQAMEDLAQRHNVNKLQLHSTLNAVTFYESIGYFRGAPATNRLPNGTELPCVVMTKRLG